MSKKLSYGAVFLLLAWGSLAGTAVAQGEDPLRLKICDTEGECCLGGQSQTIDEAWIDPQTGDLNVSGDVLCLPGWPAFVEFDATPNPVSTGEEFNITWEVLDADVCFAASEELSEWNGPRSLSGSETYTAGDPQMYTLVLYCTNSVGADFRHVELVVSD